MCGLATSQGVCCGGLMTAGAMVLRCGTSVFGEQQRLIKTNQDGSPVISKFITNYPTTPTVKELIPFYHVVGMPKSMIPVMTAEQAEGVDLHQKYPYWIQKCNQAVWKNGIDTIDWFPKEPIYYAIWSMEDWATNTQTTDMLMSAIAFH